MGIRFIQCTTTAQAEELLEAGLLWKNVDMTYDRSETEWVPAEPHMKDFVVCIDNPPRHWNHSCYLPIDFAYAVED